MVETTPSLTQAQRRAQRQAQAVRVLAMHTAKREVKEQLRSQGIKAIACAAQGDHSVGQSPALRGWGVSRQAHCRGQAD